MVGSVLLLVAVAAVVVLAQEDTGTCQSPDGPVRPPSPSKISLFNEWGSNSTVSLAGGGQHTVAVGKLQQAGNRKSYSTFAVLPGVVKKDEVSQIIELINDEDLDYDPDTVDGMPTQEIYIDNVNLRAGGTSKAGFETPVQKKDREQLRGKLKAITDTILNERITPLVREHYKDRCNTPGRVCTPCWSLIRRYREGQRKTHGTHRDGHAFITVVVSLKKYGDDFTGGLYVSPSSSHRHYVALSEGDAVMHRGDLLHGVEVFKPYTDKPTERWSWIIWYKDSETCDDHGEEWFKDCAETGNAVCQLCHAIKLGHTEDLSEDLKKEIIDLNVKAADGGLGEAMVKLARAYMHETGWGFEYDPYKAEQLYKKAIEVNNEPGAHYGLARMLLEIGQQDDAVERAVKHLEHAAVAHHEYAMFNLGLARLYGYGNNGVREPDLAAEWFEASKLPEGYMAMAMYQTSRGDEDKAKAYESKARVLGFGTPWRKTARENAGSGGFGHVKLNLPWKKMDNGIGPPPEW